MYPPTLLGENRSIPTFFPSLDFFILDEGQAEFNIWGYIIQVSSTPSTVATQHITLYHLFILEVSFGTLKLFLKLGELSSHLGIILEDGGGHQPKKEAPASPELIELCKTPSFFAFLGKLEAMSQPKLAFADSDLTLEIPSENVTWQNFSCRELESLEGWKIWKYSGCKTHSQSLIIFLMGFREMSF